MSAELERFKKDKLLLVLAGGFGTRLRSLISDVPKPLAPVLGDPFLKHLILNWKAQGINNLVLLLHYEADKIQELISKMKNIGLLEGIKIDIIVEKKPLGTGGSVSNAVKSLSIKDSFLVANADTWLSEGIEAMIVSAPCSIGFVEVNDISRYGGLHIKDGYVLLFNEKKGEVKPGFINAGLYHLAPEVFQAYNSKSAFSIEETVFPDLVKSNQLRAVEIKGDFVDIGIPSDYLSFCDRFNKGKINET